MLYETDGIAFTIRALKGRWTSWFRSWFIICYCGSSCTRYWSPTARELGKLNLGLADGLPNACQGSQHYTTSVVAFHRKCKIPIQGNVFQGSNFLSLRAINDQFLARCILHCLQKQSFHNNYGHISNIMKQYWSIWHDHFNFPLFYLLLDFLFPDNLPKKTEVYLSHQYFFHSETAYF